MDRDLLDAMFGTKPETRMQDVWNMMGQKAKGIIRLYLANSVLLNVHGEDCERSLEEAWRCL